MGIETGNKCPGCGHDESMHLPFEMAIVLPEELKTPEHLKLEATPAQIEGWRYECQGRTNNADCFCTLNGSTPITDNTIDPAKQRSIVSPAQLENLRKQFEQEHPEAVAGTIEHEVAMSRMPPRSKEWWQAQQEAQQS